MGQVGMNKLRRSVALEQHASGDASSVTNLVLLLQAISGGLTQRDVDEVITICHGACKYTQ